MKSRSNCGHSIAQEQSKEDLKCRFKVPQNDCLVEVKRNPSARKLKLQFVLKVLFSTQNIHNRSPKSERITLVPLKCKLQKREQMSYLHINFVPILLNFIVVVASNALSFT